MARLLAGETGQEYVVQTSSQAAGSAVAFPGALTPG